MSTPPPALVLQGLSCAIGGRTVLERVDLVVEAGQMVAVVGVNGSGKSTLLRTLAGLLAPVAGAARVGGAVDVHAMSARDRARQIAFVAQEERPPADMVVAEFVALGRLPYRQPWARGRDDRRLAVEALAAVGMQDAAGKFCADLSGGERRRVSLARGLVQDCELLVLDEPTNHLDVRHQIELLDLLRTSGRTIVTAIHDLGLAAAHVEHVLVLHEGRGHAAGPPQVVLTASTVSEVFGVRATYLTGPDHQQHLVVGPGRAAYPTLSTGRTP